MSQVSLQKQIENLADITDNSHSLFCLKLSPMYMRKMSDADFDQLMKLIQVYRQDVILLMGLSNSPYDNDPTKNEV